MVSNLLHSWLYLPQLGILKQNLLCTKKVVPDDASLQYFRTVTIYKHYLLFFNERNTKNECFVLDTQKGIFMNSSMRGSGLGCRYDSFLSYWKDNKFVLFGDGISTQTDPDSTDEETFVLDVQILEVNEEDCKFLFFTWQCFSFFF